MKILHAYLLKNLIRNLILSSIILTSLFLTVDFFDRIDNVLAEEAEFWIAVKYFLLKIPTFLSLTLPIAMIIATMFTLAILSKNSEITAMRASGIKINNIAIPFVCVALTLSVFSIFLSETIVPFSSRRSREIYNIDIRQKHKKGNFSQEDLWWRDKKKFYNAEIFDSRTNSIHKLGIYEIGKGFNLKKKTSAKEAKWIDPHFGWTIHPVKRLIFNKKNPIPKTESLKSITLPIPIKPEDFYDIKTDPLSMTYLQMKRFINKQKENGVNAKQFYADLYAKFSFPFVILICTFIVIPFSLRPARNGGIALSFIAGITIAFIYYVVHSLSLSLGRADLLNPLLAAWVGNILMGIIAIILNIGSEAPR